MRTRGNERGFTLVEVVIVIVVIGIVATVAIPALQQWIPNKRLKAATRDIVSVIAQAKAEAIRRGEQVTVRLDYRNADNAKLLKEQQTFVMFMDKPDNAGNRDGECDDDEEILMQSGALPNRVVFDDSKTTCIDKTLSFNPRALPVSAKTGAGVGQCTVRLCVTDSKNEPSTPCREVIVSAAGRVKTEVP